jgi:hypothetical protein
MSWVNSRVGKMLWIFEWCRHDYSLHGVSFHSIIGPSISSSLSIIIGPSALCV